MTMEQVVIHLQQELFTLRAQVAAESGLADAVRAIKQSRDSSSSERHSESLRCKRPWSSEGILWQTGGSSTVVEEDGGILCWCDQGVRDDVGVGS